MYPFTKQKRRTGITSKGADRSEQCTSNLFVGINAQLFDNKHKSSITPERNLSPLKRIGPGWQAPKHPSNSGYVKTCGGGFGMNYSGAVFTYSRKNKIR
jgi:hypothetical protein